MKLKNKFLLAFTTLQLTACAQNGFFSPKRYSRKDISYPTLDGQHLRADLFLPQNAVGKIPIVIVIHGGGWSSRSGDMEDICQRLAESGFAALNITYRFAPKFHYPVQLNDVKLAADWLNSHANEYQIDINKVYTWGYSAGAQLAFMLGNQKDLGFSIKGIVVGGTPSNLSAYPKSSQIKNLIGQSFADNPKAWQDASPVSLVSAKTPPVFVYHGEDDQIVGIDQAEILVKKLNEVKVRNEFFVVKNTGHIMVYFFSNEAKERALHFLKSLTEPAGGAQQINQAI